MKSVVREGRGTPRLEEVPRPAPRAGHVLVRTCASLVSAGTERSASEFASLSLVGKAARRPDLVRQVLEKVRRDGIWETQRAVRSRLQTAEPLGYSCAGIVEEDGTGEHPVGSLVACAGGGHASHAEYNLVPRNMIAAAPAGVTAEQAAFATIGSVALHAARLARCGLGESVAVVGLGLLGQLAVQLLKASGCQVFGLDPVERRTALASELGCDVVANDPASLARAVAERTHRRGVDAVIIAASTKDAAPVSVATEISRGRGRIVVLGDIRLDLDRRVFYEKELRLVVSRSYGPGRYDRDYEEKGIDYPYEYVRWTLKRNMGAFLALAPRLRIEPLISHRFTIEEADRVYALLSGERQEPYLGILLVYAQESPAAAEGDRVELGITPVAGRHREVGVSVLGAGNYARNTLLPALAKVEGLRRVAIVTAKGLSAWDAGRRFGFERCATDVGDALGEDTDLVVIATRHSQHAGLVKEALGRGKAVFVEKPLCTSDDELEELRSAYARSSRPFLMVGYNRRFAPLVARLRTSLGPVGRPLVLNYRVNAGPLTDASWVLDAEEGGGRLIGEACHFVDLLMHVVGAPPRVVRVVRPSTHGHFGDRETFVALLEFGDGSIATLTYSADGDPAHPKERLEVIGGGAVAILEDFRSLTITHGGRRKRWRTLGQDKGHLGALQATVDAIRTGRPAPIPFQEVVVGTRATFALRASVAIGDAVALPAPVQDATGAPASA